MTNIVDNLLNFSYVLYTQPVIYTLSIYNKFSDFRKNLDFSTWWIAPFSCPTFILTLDSHYSVSQGQSSLVTPDLLTFFLKIHRLSLQPENVLKGSTSRTHYPEGLPRYHFSSFSCKKEPCPVTSREKGW